MCVVGMRRGRVFVNSVCRYLDILIRKDSIDAGVSYPTGPAGQFEIEQKKT